jgi:hypothetical protein
VSDDYDAIREAIASIEIDPNDLELVELARQIAEPVEPIVYEAHPTDEGEGAWWLAPPDPWRAYLDEPREPSNDWWAGCLEGIRIGIELARQGEPPVEGTVDPVAGIPRPVLPGRRLR